MRLIITAALTTLAERTMPAWIERLEGVESEGTASVVGSLAILVSLTCGSPHQAIAGAFGSDARRAACAANARCL
jgi:hypothetical protein